MIKIEEDAKQSVFLTNDYMVSYEETYNPVLNRNSGSKKNTELN